MTLATAVFAFVMAFDFLAVFPPVFDLAVDVTWAAIENNGSKHSQQHRAGATGRKCGAGFEVLQARLIRVLRYVIRKTSWK